MNFYFAFVVFNPQVPVQEDIGSLTAALSAVDLQHVGEQGVAEESALTSVLAFRASFFEPLAFMNRTTTHAIIKIIPILISSFFIINKFLSGSVNITTFLLFHIYLNVNLFRIFKNGSKHCPDFHQTSLVKQ